LLVGLTGEVRAESVDASRMIVHAPAEEV
jgi:hypothetical protein